MGNVSQFDILSQLVESALADWQHVRQHEAEYGPADWSDAASAMKIEKSIYALPPGF